MKSPPHLAPETCPLDAAGPPWLHAAHYADPDELALAQRDWQLRYDQLSCGRFTGSVQHLRLPGLRLVRETANRAVRQRGHIGPGDVGFALALSHAGNAFFHGQRLDAESLMIGRGDELDLTSPDDFMLIGMVVDGRLLSDVWHLLYRKPWADWLDRKVVVRARPGMAAHVRALHLRLMDSVASDPTLLQHEQGLLQMRDAILIDWLEAVPERVDTSELATIEARRRVVERVCERVLARPDQPPTLLKVCSEAGTSPRKLEYCFRDVLGITPARYLRAVRLNGVRRALKQAADGRDTVHDIAARWGFWHMGAFSADYKAQFGELPSATHRLALGRAGAVAK
ncbi:MAG: helix-turn-helix domain-containing protein [Aquincola tertiaricarbonis]